MTNEHLNCVLWIEVYQKNSLGKHIYMTCVVYIQIKIGKILNASKKDQMEKKKLRFKILKRFPFIKCWA